LQREDQPWGRTGPLHNSTEWSLRLAPPTAVLRNAWSSDINPTNVFMAWYLAQHRDNFSFYLHTVTATATRSARIQASCYRSDTCTALTFVHKSNTCRT